MTRQDGIIKIVPGERFTPFSLANKLGAAVLLESSSFVKGKERYSLLMVKKAFTLEQRAGEVFYIDEVKRTKLTKPDILDALGYFADQHRTLGQDFPFPSGGLGFLSYEFARYCDKFSVRDRPDPLGLPEACFMFGHVFVVFDHYTDRLYLIGMNYAEHEIDLDAAVKEVETRIEDMNFNYLKEDTRKYEAVVVEGGDGKAAYMESVERIREEVIAGNLLQAVPSRRLVVKTDIPALEAYRRLRSVNPSPYLFYLDFGDYQLFGASPEMHLKIKNGEAAIKPIAGTRRRGETSDQDKALEKELLEDPKERAEHLMLVDLARNDLGRISVPGSVKVKSFMDVERFSHVMHIVSETTGKLAEGMTVSRAVKATFPAGTVSGAPKIRAVDTVDSLEGHPRSFYAGLVGYFEPDGGLDSCITIRSALKKGDRLVLQAGAGVVYDSDPEREYRETGEKLQALLAAVGLEA